MSLYVSNTGEDQARMLAQIPGASLNSLFECIPGAVQLNKELDLPKPLCEMGLLSHMRQLAGKNIHGGQYACFLGAGAYDHFIPSTVDSLLMRQEFYTAYTPYQPEISQGTLQAIYEYQTMICELTGMDVTNASMYDGASAVAEGAIMACSATSRDEVLVAKTINPEYMAVIKTYCSFRKIKVIEIEEKNGQINMEVLEAAMGANTAAVLVQSPNFYGIIESLQPIANLAHKNTSLVIACVDPISLAILKSPGELGADIVVGEGQALGNTLSFGGPYFGFFAATEAFVRKMPGRIVGETVDAKGRRGFVLTLQTREQHIRREKATSNICSNQALNALAGAIYLTMLGKKGLTQVATLCVQKAHYLEEKLLLTNGFKKVYEAPYFKEFVVSAPKDPTVINKELLSYGILGGLDLKDHAPSIKNGWLLAVTEKRTREDMDKLVEKVVEQR